MKAPLIFSLGTILFLNQPSCDNKPKNNLPASRPSTSQKVTTESEKSVRFYHHREMEIETPSYQGKTCLLVRNYFEESQDLFAGYIVDSHFREIFPDSQTPVTLLRLVDPSDFEKIKQRFKKPESNLSFWLPPDQ